MLNSPITSLALQSILAGNVNLSKCDRPPK